MSSECIDDDTAKSRSASLVDEASLVNGAGRATRPAIRWSQFSRQKPGPTLSGLVAKGQREEMRVYSMAELRCH